MAVLHNVTLSALAGHLRELGDESAHGESGLAEIICGLFCAGVLVVGVALRRHGGLLQELAVIADCWRSQMGQMVAVSAPGSLLSLLLQVLPGTGHGETAQP